MALGFLGPLNGVQPASAYALGTGMTSGCLSVIHGMSWWVNFYTRLPCTLHFIFLAVALYEQPEQNFIGLWFPDLQLSRPQSGFFFVTCTYTCMHTGHTSHKHTQTMQTQLRMCSTFQLWSVVELKNKGFGKVKIGQTSVLALLAWKGTDSAHAIHCVNMFIRNTLKRLVREECICTDLNTAW